MVLKWLWDLLSGIISGLLDALPKVPVPDWLSQASAAIATVTSYLAGAGGWVPWTLLGIVVTAVVVAIGITVVIRGVRIAASFLTLGGGGA